GKYNNIIGRCQVHSFLNIEKRKHMTGCWHNSHFNKPLGYNINIYYHSEYEYGSMYNVSDIPYTYTNYDHSRKSKLREEFIFLCIDYINSHYLDFEYFKKLIDIFVLNY